MSGLGPQINHVVFHGIQGLQCRVARIVILNLPHQIPELLELITDALIGSLLLQLIESSSKKGYEANNAGGEIPYLDDFRECIRNTDGEQVVVGLHQP